MEENVTKKTRIRRTDEQRLVELEDEVKKIKAKIEERKQKEYTPICNNLGKLLVEMSGFNLDTLTPEQRAACKKDVPTAKAKAVVIEMAKAIAADTTTDEGEGIAD